MKLTRIASLLVFAAASATAQVSVSVGGPGGVNVNTGGAGGVSVDTGNGGGAKSGKTATSGKGNAVYVDPGKSSSSITHSPGTTVTTGKDDDDDASGISVVNGNVKIDGVKVPATATRWTGKDGTKYRIKRSSKGNVSVEEIDD
ncbi:hypothetical protein [Accumulibacter sp.]|jgi:hypothetical protein|uniref:hypothetical protein n=1 Tax=Accumulibacter sp. TaxID=2053492 RepID=UPI002BBAF1A4|nr:hypothetical protein [Accumulibacter sp.]HPU79377.1 hypothetical protein [Accumulibacter sp.]